MDLFDGSRSVCLGIFFPYLDDGGGVVLWSDFFGARGEFALNLCVRRAARIQCICKFFCLGFLHFFILPWIGLGYFVRLSVL